MPRGGADTVTIVYPPGCREVTEDLGPDELIRRLKTLAHTFQSMGQDEGAYQEYVPLALHLADDYFLLHPSRDVQLLIACCIADVLRVYAPEAPYKDPDQVKTIFQFLIKQLSGLKDPKDPAFKRYFYLLENLAYVKSFNMCFELEECQDIFCGLFSLMFKIVNDEHSGKVKSFMLDVLCPLITESDVVSNELLDIILMNVVEPNKSQRKNAYLLAKELVVKCSDTLEPYIQAFFNHVLILGKEEKKLNICKKVYDLIYELNHICPSVLLAVLPQLEFKLKSTDEQERIGSVSLLARMFSEKDSTLAIHHRQLWQAFLGRFNDISVTIRTKCVQYSMHFLLNHPELRRDITETLKLRQHDSEESVRYEVVMAIVTTAKKDFSIVSDSEDLLNFVKERTLDKKFKIRKEAMCGLAMIYKKHLSNPDVPEATKKAVTWIKDKILHGYYMTGMDDRLLVERLLNTCLVPYQLPADERMKKLYYLLGTIDENATKAFIELQKHQLAVRRSVGELIELHRRPQDEEREKEIMMRISLLSKYLPDAVKAQEFIKKFSKNLTDDESLLNAMEIVINPDISCRDCAEAVSRILKKLGQPVMTNLYYNTVKMLLERISSVMVDREALSILVGYVEECLKGGDLIDDIGLNPDTAGERGLRLLFVLSFVFPSHFLNEGILSHLLSFLSMDEEMVAPLVLSVLTFVGKYKPIGEAFPEIGRLLIPICQKFSVEGTPKQAKQSIRCLYVNTTQNQDTVFTEILEKLKENMVIASPHYRTAIVSLGHIAYNLPEKFPIQIKNIVSRKVVKDLLMKDCGDRGNNFCDDEWCPEDELPEDTRCKLEGMKMMARWLLGLKTDVISAQKTFRMLNAFIVHRGDLLDEGKLGKPEMACLRLAAGCCMLKICEQKGVGDQFTAEQFYNLSLLMNDEEPRVREAFAVKLHKGLSRGIPQKCLPLDFMGYYALAGQEQDKKIKATVRQYMILDITKRRDYIKSLLMSGGSDKAADQLPHIMPDYMLVFAVPVLAHDPEFTAYDDEDQLQRVRQCLWFILEPLMMKNDNYCFGFYKALIEKMKNQKDAVRGEDEAMNHKLWAVCDLAMGLIMSKTINFEMKEFPSEPRIPPMYFKRHEDALFVNSKIYLPPQFQYTAPKKSGITIAVVGVDKSAAQKRARVRTRGSSIDSERTEEGLGAIDAEPAEASDTKIQLPGIEESDASIEHSESDEPPSKRANMNSQLESDAEGSAQNNYIVPDLQDSISEQSQSSSQEGIEKTDTKVLGTDDEAGGKEEAQLSDEALSSQENDKNNTNVAQPTKKRGRPPSPFPKAVANAERKKARSEPKSKDGDSTKKANTSPDSSEETVKPRGRGRPPKNSEEKKRPGTENSVEKNSSKTKLKKSAEQANDEDEESKKESSKGRKKEDQKELNKESKKEAQKETKKGTQKEGKKDAQKEKKDISKPSPRETRNEEKAQKENKSKKVAEKDPPKGLSDKRRRRSEPEQSQQRKSPRIASSQDSDDSGAGRRTRNRK